MDFKEQVRQASDIIEVIQEFVEIKKRGKNLVGLCPLHEEKDPSFTIYPETQTFNWNFIVDPRSSNIEADALGKFSYG